MDTVALAAALVETFEGHLDQPLVIAAAVALRDEVAVRVEPADQTDSLFEVGSVTKTMTATVLAALVTDGVLGLDDPIGTWLDAGPNDGITVGQLARHTSGLPRLAPNHFDVCADRDDPYASFGEEEAGAGLRSATRTEVGTAHYSNFGYQLLGLVLCRASGTDFDALLRERLWAPLGMTAARVTGTKGAQVQGYRGNKPVSGWHPLLHGPGGVEASAADMATYLRAVVAPPDGPAGDAIRFAIEHGLGWVTAPDGAIWHNGGTGGFHSMLLADRENARGAVAMVNSADLPELDAAIARAARGLDPRPARPQPVGDEFDHIATAVAGHMVARDWASLRALMAATCAEALTEERLAGAWSAVMAPRGAVNGTRIEARSRANGAVEVTIHVDCATAPGTIRTYFSDARQLVGLRIS